MSRGALPGHVKERLRLFFAVWLDCDDAEAAMWAVLETDRKERHDELARARAGVPLAQRDPVVAAVLTQVAERTGVPVEEIQRPGLWRRGNPGRKVVRARDVAARALRAQGYSYRAIGAALGRPSGLAMVHKALGRAAGRRDVVALAEVVRRRARRLAARPLRKAA